MAGWRSDARQPSEPVEDTHRAHSGHGWMTFICCIPMLIPASLLVVGVSRVAAFGLPPPPPRP
jgi:hypothetical protein